MAYHEERQKAHERHAFVLGRVDAQPVPLYKKQTQQGLVRYAGFWNKKAEKYTGYRSNGVKVSGKQAVASISILKVFGRNSCRLWFVLGRKLTPKGRLTTGGRICLMGDSR